ncbi:uracil-5--methyltransferase [Rhizodiscina lignyota]|uniref:tRNA (uracil(54)-C(5))-methyltransferase n=1 Tax=Rhizodiscina lignyota TaxID=1504668 RepID=A0A9P4I6S4_9PEZI|nr:uracil-5--methyltransferase [Rhizodiscina lignyota]
MASSVADSARTEQHGEKRKHRGGYRFKNKKQKASKDVDLKDGSHEAVLLTDIKNMLSKLAFDGEKEQGSTERKQLEYGTEVELTISELSSTGDGLAYDPESGEVYTVPYTVPQDTVKAKVVRHAAPHGISHTVTDFLEVIRPSPLRDDGLIQCGYFAKCAGCQFQMLSYDEQLEHKRRIVEKAFKNFSEIRPENIPTVRATIGSPLQYGYRTKLTPHFDGPPDSKRSDRRRGIHETFKEVPAIGFMPKGSRKTMDIEDCPIGTGAVRMGMKKERKRVADELNSFKRGATLLLRESTVRVSSKEDGSASPTSNGAANIPKDAVEDAKEGYTDYKTCVTDSNAKTTEYIDSFVFTNRAGAFFQNNNSILSPFTSFVRENVLPPASGEATPKLKYLIDAYCGSGLFSITLASLFTKTIGIDISDSSITSANENARLNKLPESQAEFIAADAKELFASVKFQSEEAVVIIDPPRKGCDEDFIRQLMRYAPARIVYVSCNVHTQARDVGMMVNGLDDGGDVTYEIESLRGFDFFPQTGHVEGVAVLNRRNPGNQAAESAAS